MSKSKLIIAAAGSGKTTLIVREALKVKDGNTLITTFTQANELEIRKKIIELNRCIPTNIYILPWFSFLMRHGVKPYQGQLFEQRINGLFLTNEQSARGIAEKRTKEHYFTPNGKIYSDKIAKFARKCNELSGGAVIDRLSKIYSHIFIDEVQDLAGYDLEIVKLLLKSKTRILLVGDPRQATYSTNNSLKNKQFSKSNIVHFFEDKSIIIETDSTSLNHNFRSNKTICDLSNRLYLDHPATTSGNSDATGHDGVFFVGKGDVESYLERYDPIQLRDKRTVITNPKYPAMNFGESKGLTFDRVLIYPTKAYLDWLLKSGTALQPVSRAKLYVAITRAKYSVAFVNDKSDPNRAITTWTSNV